MDKNAVDMSADSLARAIASLRDMEAAQTFETIEIAWSHFLTDACRVFTRLEQGAKTNRRSEAWFGQQKNARRTIPILMYIHHARNADEHGLARITYRRAPGIALGIGPGAWRFDGTTGPNGQMQVTALGGQIPGISKFAEAIPGKVSLIRVRDRGVYYDVPLDSTGSHMSPREVATLVITYLQNMIDEARNLPD